MQKIPDGLKSYKAILGITILLIWILIIFGVFSAPFFVWIILIIASIIFYFTLTKSDYSRSKSMDDVIRDMDAYMERKAEEQFGEEEEKSEEKYDFEDDIKIIKK